MAFSKEEIKTLYPLPVYNYRVRIGSETYGFAEVSGLSVQYKVITYKHGLSWIEGSEEVAGQFQPLTITLRKGMVARGSELLEWLSGAGFLGLNKRDLFIDLCDEKGFPVITWAIKEAFPTRLDGPSFTANNNDAAIEKLELKAGSLTITYHESSQSVDFQL